MSLNIQVVTSENICHLPITSPEATPNKEISPKPLLYQNLALVCLK